MTIKKEKKPRVSNSSKDLSAPTPLTLEGLFELDRQNDEIVEVSCANGKHVITANRVFRPTKIQEVIIDFQSAIQILKENEVAVEVIKNIFPIYQMCIIKQFTNLPIQHLDMTKPSDVNSLIKVGKALLDNGVMVDLYNSFDEKEIKKVNEMMRQSKSMEEEIGEALIAIQFAEADKISAVVSESENNAIQQSE